MQVSLCCLICSHLIGRCTENLGGLVWLCAQRKLFHLMGWLDAQLFRRAAAMRYGGASGAAAPSDADVDPGLEHWRKVVVRPACLPHAALRYPLVVMQLPMLQSS